MASREVALPPARPLKRSASTASLPTPPRTQRRRKNARSKRGTSSGEDSDTGGESRVFLGSDEEEEGDRARSSKRRRLSHADEDEEQDAFWSGVGERASASKPKLSQKPSSRSLSEPEMGTGLEEENSDSDTSFLSRRRMKQTTTTGSAPVSPPPSYRRPKAAKVVSLKSGRAGAIAALRAVAEEEEDSAPSEPGAKKKSPANDSPATLTSSPPTTPKTPKAQIRSSISPITLIRDSPENPFLSSPESPSGSSAVAERFVGKGGILEERPTTTMVFRGVKREFYNPHYNHRMGRPKSPDPSSLLPPEHPDFSPDMRGRPKALWPRKAKNPLAEVPEEPTTPTKSKGRNAAALLKTPPMTVKRAAGKAAKAKSQNLIDSDDEDEDRKLDPDAVLPMRPFRLFS